MGKRPRIIDTAFLHSLFESIDQGLDRLENLFKPSKYNLLSTIEQSKLLQEGRRLINQITETAFFTIGGIPLEEIFIDRALSLSKKLRGKGFSIGRLRKKTTAETNRIKANFYDSLTDYKAAMNKTLKFKVDTVSTMLKAYDEKQVSGILDRLERPRGTLINFDNRFFTQRVKGTVTKVTGDVQKRLIKTLDKGILESWDYDKTYNHAAEIVSEQFPAGKVGHLSFKRYVEGWILDARSMAHSKATVATMLKYGVDLVRVNHHSANVCDRCLWISHHGYNGSNIYSITGQTPGFPVLLSFPPFHPFCYCTADPVESGLQEFIDLSDEEGDQFAQRVLHSENRRTMFNIAVADQKKSE